MDFTQMGGAWGHKMAKISLKTRVLNFNDFSKPNKKDTFFYIRTQNQKMSIDHGKNIKMVCQGGRTLCISPPKCFKKTLFLSNISTFHNRTTHRGHYTTPPKVFLHSRALNIYIGISYIVWGMWSIGHLHILGPKIDLNCA